MAHHNDRGKLGEELAEKYLREKEFDIVHRNWKYYPYELDIVAIKNNLPHFIEVKLRSSNKYGPPEGNVSRKKIKSMLKAIDEYLYRNPFYDDFRIDILSITLSKEQEPEYFFIEDVYL